jgi:two-component system, OmpR family, phosphate regulon sensor histidine kinase PhoR
MGNKNLLNQSNNLNKNKDDFLNLVAHELRTPITVLKTSLEYLGICDPTADKKNYNDLLNISLKEIEKLYQLIEKIILLQNLKLRQYNLHPVNINIKNCITNIILNNLDWNKKNVEIKLDLPDELVINFDERLLNYMFSNLIENGLKFNNENGLLKISQVYKNLFLFEDTGIGISKEEQRYIFDEFRQVEDIKHHSSGLGLGLAIVKYICYMTNIIIELESNKNSGTKIYLIFV